MVSTMQSETLIFSVAQSVIDWSAKLLHDAPLTAEQREDIEAIHMAAKHFMESAQAEVEIIRNGAAPEETQGLRHNLRNHLNIVSGFSRLFVKELPDNLLVHMLLIRNIHAASLQLIELVDKIR